MKIEQLIADVTAVRPRPLARAEREMYRKKLDVFWSVQPATVVGEPLCDLGTSF